MYSAHGFILSLKFFSFFVRISTNLLLKYIYGLLGMMAGFDLHSVCARCRDKKKGKDACVEKPDSECQHCKVLTPEQLAQLSTPSY